MGHRGINKSNLIYIKLEDTQGKVIETNIKVATLNVRSLKNKDNIVAEELRNSSIDIAILTETWIKESDENWCDVCALNKMGLSFETHNRVGKQGGGIALVSNEIYNKVKLPKVTETLNCEYAMWKISVNRVKLGIVGIYRPPNTCIPAFTDELIDILDEIKEHNVDQTILLGDFNIHIHDITSNEVVGFITTMDMLGCVQHIMAPTHMKGNTLDLIFTCDDNPRVNIIDWSCGIFISDHALVSSTLSIRKSKYNRKQVKVRKTNLISDNDWLDNLHADNIKCADNLQSVCNQLNDELLRLMDELAPERILSISSRPKTEWLTSELYSQRKIVRNRERIWKRYGANQHWQAYTRERNRYNHMLNYNKRNTICSHIQKIGKDAKSLNKYINKLTGTKDINPMPSNRNEQQLCEDFADYFLNKIQRIRTDLSEFPLYNPSENTGIPRFRSFAPMTSKQVQKIIMEMSSKSCEIDIIPTTILKKLLPKLLPVITHIVNLSLTNGSFLEDWKIAIVRPLLKKINAELIEKNYRPVSNLSFLSKIIERCMLSQFLEHCNNFDLIPDFQSAYRENFSTETSLLRMSNDILIAMDNQKVTMTGVIDLSAAFDTVHHETFINIMNKLFGVEDTALKWFAEYLSPRRFKVCVGSSYSSDRQIDFSVPQGSCAGAPLFTAYCSPIQYFVNGGFTLNGFADDHSVRKDFNPNSRDEENLVFTKLFDNLISIKQWMSEMRLKMNGEKTEYILFGNSRQVKKCMHNELTLDGDTIIQSKCIKYLGAHLDMELSMKVHVTTKCKAAWLNLRKLQAIRKFLTQDIANTLAVMLCLTHLDYANSLLFGLPAIVLKSLQRVQNACAKMVLRMRKFDSSTQALKQLHWLPIIKRIDYKIACIVFKCVNDKAPKYLIELLQRKPIRRTLRSNTDDLLLELPRCNTKTYGPRSFSYSGPKVWNRLPYQLRASSSIDVF